jgi:NitT/TauT family transport system substrate-binding protein
MLKLLSFCSSPRKRGPSSSYDWWIWPLGPRFRGDERRKGLAGLFSFAIAALLASLVAPATAAETLRVGKAGREAFSFVPADVGARSGLFKKHNLDLEISSFGGDARIQQAMAADAIDIALGSGPGMAFIAKGSPVKGIAAMAGPPLLFALVVRADDAVKSPDDLKGRKVGVSTVGSVTSWIVSEVSRQKGWGFDGVTQVPIGEDASRIAALNPRRSTQPSSTLRWRSTMCSAAKVASCCASTSC